MESVCLVVFARGRHVHKEHNELSSPSSGVLLWFILTRVPRVAACCSLAAQQLWAVIHPPQVPHGPSEGGCSTFDFLIVFVVRVGEAIESSTRVRTHRRLEFQRAAKLEAHARSTPALCPAGSALPPQASSGGLTAT